MKKIFSTKYWLFFPLLAVVFSCSKTVELEIDPQDSYKYYPIEVGDFKIYQVINKSYGVGQKVKTDTVLRKEIVKSKIINQNSTTFIIERQKKGESDSYYKAEMVFQIITNPQKILVGERNVYKVLLNFPLYYKAKWNINEINGLDNDFVKIVEIANDKIPNGLISNKNLISVLGDSSNNIIDFKVNYHLFSKNIGMIYKETTDIDYCQTNPDDPKGCYGKRLIESGNREFIKLIEYGTIAQ